MEHDEVKRVSAELEELLGHFPGEKMEDVNQAWKEMAASLNRTGEPEHRESGDLDLANQNAANQNIENQNAANQNTANPELAESEPEHTDRDDGEKENLRNSRGKWSENRGRKKILCQPNVRKEEGQKGQTLSELEKSRSIFRKNDALWAAFLIPVVVMIVIFAQRGIFPFGSESFLRTDMYHQYAPFFSEFQEKLTRGGSLLYSWNIGMGVNFSALYAYYLASPLNWLLILCPKNLIIEFMTYLIVIKIGLSGLSFAWYLRKHCKTSDFGVAFFGIFYALSGYMAAYSWNIMWLDCIVLFPLILLGVERLVREKKCFLYCISLGLSILSNYYISIMICIFLVLYFAALLILDWEKGWRARGRNILDFGMYSLAAGGLAAVVLLPEIFALQATASGDVNFPQTFSSYFSIFDMFARHLPNVEIEIGLDHWPNIYCGVAVLLFFFLYLGNRKILVREKVVYCGLLLLFFASFSINVLNFIWHGFHYPNSLPCRQSFIYIALMLLVCYRAYMQLEDTSWKEIAACFGGAVVFVILAEKLVEQEHFEFHVYYLSILFLAMYAGLLYLYKKKPFRENRILVMALLLVSVEAAINTTVTSVTTTSRTAYISDNEDVRKLLEDIRPAKTLYRVEKVTRKTKNDGAWMNFPSVSLFSSTANADLTEFFKQIGCEGNTNAYSITGSTPLVDSLFSVRYGLYSEEQNNEWLMLIGQSGTTWLYERQFTLPVAFMVERELGESWHRDVGNPALAQNELCQVIGTESVLLEVESQLDKGKVSFIPEVTGEYYAYVSNRKVEEVEMIKGEETQTFKNVNRGFLLELGICNAGEEVVLQSKTEDQKMEAGVYRFSYEALEQVYDTLNETPMIVTSWSDNSLEGMVSVQNAGTLFTSIPYDEGWEVLVDGVPSRKWKIFDAFLAVNLPEGEHTVTLSYEPQGLRLGAMITAGSIAFLLAAAGIGVLKKRKQEDLEFQKLNERED